LAQGVVVGENYEASQLTNAFPPDTMGSVGPDHVIELVNDKYKVFEKGANGTSVVDIPDRTFWSSGAHVGLGNSDTSSPFDPRIEYDPFVGRFYAVDVDFRSSADASYLFAVSKTSNPLDGWDGWRIDGDSTDRAWPDFPTMGFDADNVYITAKLFPNTSGGSKGQLLILPKDDLLAATPNIDNLYLNETLGLTTYQPVVDYDGTGPSAASGSQTHYLYDDWTSGFFTRAITESGGTFSLSGSSFNSVLSSRPTPHGGRQPDPSKADLDVDDDRFSSRLVRVNDEVWGVQTRLASNGIDNAIRWFKVDADTNSLIQEGFIELTGTDWVYPAISVNKDGDVVIGMTGSGPSAGQEPASYFVVGTTDGSNVTTFGTPVKTRVGDASYERLHSINRNRWGDYSQVTVDPADPNIFWAFQEFADSSNIWAVQATEIIVYDANEFYWGQLNSATSTEPVSELVAASGAFASTTRWAGGSAPGSTDTAIFSRQSFSTTQTVTFAANTINGRASVRQGTYVFDLGGNTYTLGNSSASTPSLAISEFQGTASLTINNGQLNSYNTQIGGGLLGTASLTVSGSTTTWANVLSVFVGGDSTTATGGTGSLTVNNDAFAFVGGTLKIYAPGAVTLDSGATLDASAIDRSAGGAFNFLGGTLAVDTFTGDLAQQGGTLAPGNSPGITNIVGSYAIFAGTVAIELDGTTPGSGHDQVAVTGSAALAGNLDLSLGFAPTLGQTFDILTSGAASVTGSFATVSGVVVDPATGLAVTYQSDRVRVEVALLGDINLDGVVDALDVDIMRLNWQGTGRQWVTGDLNGDGSVVLADLQHLADNWSAGALSPTAVQALADSFVPVPEPGSLAVLLVGLGALIRRR